VPSNAAAKWSAQMFAGSSLISYVGFFRKQVQYAMKIMDKTTSDHPILQSINFYVAFNAALL